MRFAASATALSIFAVSVESSDLELLAAQLPIPLDLGQAHLAFARDPGRLATALRRGLLFRDVGLTRGTRGLDLALLGDRRLLLLLGEEQLAFRGVELALVHRDLGVRFDRRAFLLVGRDDLGEAPHAERVEGVVLVERVERGLIQPGEGDRFEPEAVLSEVLAQHPAHLGGVFRAFVLQALHAVAGRYREHRVHQLALQRLRKLGRAEGLAGQRLGRRRDAVFGRLDPDVELRADVDAQAILGDHRVPPEPLDLELRGAHVDLGHLVQNGERETASVEHHPLPAETGAHQRPFAGCLAVVAIEEENAQAREHEQDDDGEEPDHRRAPANRAASGRRCGSQAGAGAVRTAASNPIKMPSNAPGRRSCRTGGSWVSDQVRRKYFPFQVLIALVSNLSKVLVFVYFFNHPINCPIGASHECRDSAIGIGYVAPLAGAAVDDRSGR